MPNALNAVRAHYTTSHLTDRIRTALAAVGDENQRLDIGQLAALDQFHTRGILATEELAGAAGLDATTRVLDLGSGVGGPARYLSSTYGCRVVGLDLSASFVEAAKYLTLRTGLADKVSFEVGDALDPPFGAGAFDVVFLQHVAMNIEDRARLYAQIRRMLSPGGRLATHDIVLNAGDVIYPTPWSRDGSTSFLLSEAETRQRLEDNGFTVKMWRDDSPSAMEWFKAASAAPPVAGPNLGVVMGPDFPVLAGNLGRNIREGRVGVLSAVLTRDA